MLRLVGGWGVEPRQFAHYVDSLRVRICEYLLRLYLSCDEFVQRLRGGDLWKSTANGLRTGEDLLIPLFTARKHHFHFLILGGRGCNSIHQGRSESATSNKVGTAPAPHRCKLVAAIKHWFKTSNERSNFHE